MDLKLGARLRHRLTMLEAQFLSVADIKAILEYKLSREKEFVFNGHRLGYFFHSHNNFGLTERAVEIPIVRYYLGQANYQNVLEIGNVTDHYYTYFSQAWLGKKKTVVDRYEQAYGVINEDIGAYSPNVKSDFVFSISTFEHMDADLGRNPEYRPGCSSLGTVAADNIKHVSDTLLRDEGKFVITAPLGYTPEWDTTFYSGVLDECNFAHWRPYLFRRKKEFTWEQVDVAEGRGITDRYPMSKPSYLSIVECDK